MNSIRLLGKQLNGQLLDVGIKGSERTAKLVEISPKEIKNHLVMIYFENFTSMQVEELIVFFEEAFDLKLKKSKDKKGKEYYWRPFGSKQTTSVNQNIFYEDNNRREINEAFGYESNANIIGMNYNRNTDYCSPEELGEEYFWED